MGEGRKKLAIFDLDGTLFNTDEVNYCAYRDAFKEFGTELDRAFFVSECNGRHYKEFAPRIMGSDEHIEEVHKLKKENYSKYLDKAVMNVHLFEIIRLIKNEYIIALVTTASRKNTEDILNHFEVLDLFDCLITQEDITKTKPDPEGFITTMKRFNIEPKETVIFEDSDVGILAAQRSGASVMTVNAF